MYRIVLDTETTGSVQNVKTCRAYDIGYAILDEDDNIVLTRDFVVREVFYDDLMMRSAYYADKLPQYHAEIEAGIRTVENFGNIRRTLIEDAQKYKVTQVWAYNAKFDMSALNATTAALSDSILQEFLPSGMVWCDIAVNACNLICDTTKYYAFIQKHEYFSKTGRPTYRAEIVYRYVSGNNDFVERHTGLADVLIEAEILHACRVKRKRMERGNLNAACWQTLSKGYRAFCEK